MSDERPLSGRRVLVVEDDYFLATDTCQWLVDAGAEVIGPTPSAGEACGLIESGQLDNAVVDINLGQGPTYQVARRLTREHVPFLFATGYDRSALPPQFLAVPRIEKPFRGTDLVRALSELR
jgi:CheY-like chemotaxis protein